MCSHAKLTPVQLIFSTISKSIDVDYIVFFHTLIILPFLNFTNLFKVTECLFCTGLWFLYHNVN